VSTIDLALPWSRILDDLGQMLSAMEAVRVSGRPGDWSLQITFGTRRQLVTAVAAPEPEERSNLACLVLRSVAAPFAVESTVIAMRAIVNYPEMRVARIRVVGEDDLVVMTSLYLLDLAAFDLAASVRRVAATADTLEERLCQGRDRY
jgi:hypothetical protein